MADAETVWGLLAVLGGWGALTVLGSLTWVRHLIRKLEGFRTPEY